jgi:hypothetical protein
MAYVGTPLDTTNAFQSLAGKRFSGDGSTTDFTLDSSPNSTLDIEVFVGNVRQDPNSAYTVSGTTLGFTGAPPSGTNNIYVVHQAKAVGTITPSDSSITSGKLSGNLVTPGTFDVNGQELILDADADTSITADTDDQIDFKIGNADILKFTNSSSNIRIDAVVSDKDIIFGGNDGGSSTDALTLDMSDNGAATFNDDIYIYDDKGIYFGTGVDFALGANAGETEFRISSGSTTTGGTGGMTSFRPTGDGVFLNVISTEDKGAAYEYTQDDGDDNGDQWRCGQALDGDANTEMYWSNDTSGSHVTKMRLFAANGNLQHAGSISSSHSFDYAEYWEWKTALANDDKIIETYGMTVVLDGDKVRLAEVGEEAKVIGVVRPNNTSSVIGGGQELYYKDKYEKNIWGEVVMEEYTLVDWDETLPNGTIQHHKYMKDRIPAKKIREGAIKVQENWHTLESNFEKDKDGNTIDLVVPSTSSQKTAANYVERTTYKKDKGDNKKDSKLMRPKINSSYDFSKTKSYQGRDKRRKEWCVVGLIGQVEVRDSAIVPTSWYKMKNIGTGIDLYYIK